RPLDDVFLGHLQLTRAHFEAGLTLDEARRQWARFQRPSNIGTVFHPGTARLFSYLARDRDPCLVLKSIDLELKFDQPALGALSPSRGVPIAAVNHPGRGGQRLADTIAHLRHLNELANA